MALVNDRSNETGGRGWRDVRAMTAPCRARFRSGMPRRRDCNDPPTFVDHPPAHCAATEIGVPPRVAPPGFPGAGQKNGRRPHRCLQ
jgi:hypothetical protein